MSIIQSILNTGCIDHHISSSVYQIHYGELPVLVVKHRSCQAAVALQGGQLLFWHPQQTQHPVVWLSDKSEFKRGVAIRGGVPICWPWFSLQGGEPMHGFARQCQWQLIHESESSEGVTLTLGLVNTEETEHIWPHEFSLVLTLFLGCYCQLELTTRCGIETTTALHSYFNILDITKAKVTGLGKEYIEKLSTENRPDILGEIAFNQEVDRIYTSPENISIIEDMNRCIKVTHNNASDVVVWNPWEAKSQRLSDMSDEGFKTMVCVETGRINHPLNADEKAGCKVGARIDVF